MNSLLLWAARFEHTDPVARKIMRDLQPMVRAMVRVRFRVEWEEHARAHDEFVRILRFVALDLDGEAPGKTN